MDEMVFQPNYSAVWGLLVQKLENLDFTPRLLRVGLSIANDLYTHLFPRHPIKRFPRFAESSPSGITLHAVPPIAEHLARLDDIVPLMVREAMLSQLHELQSQTEPLDGVHY